VAGVKLARRHAALALALFVAAHPAAAVDPPYESMLLRLAEILGSLHYLGGLCDSGPSPWRGEMEGLIASEGPEEARKARLIDRFNIGYSSFAAVYRSCTPAARLALERYRTEGADLAGEISARFGPVGAPAAARRPITVNGR
jgi:uncharacterized protein (TIGR02301 family)